MTLRFSVITQPVTVYHISTKTTNMQIRQILIGSKVKILSELQNNRKIYWREKISHVCPGSLLGFINQKSIVGCSIAWYGDYGILGKRKSSNF